MELAKAVLEHKEDIWKIPAEARILKINCKLNMHSAQKLIETCRELERVVFAGHAFALTEMETIKYLNEQVFVIVKGRVEGHGIREEIAEKIRELHATGGYSSQNLAEKFALPEKTIWHVLHEKKFMRNHEH